MKDVPEPVAYSRRQQQFPALFGRFAAARRASLVLALLLFARPASALELRELVRQALVDYPTIRVAEANRSVAELDVRKSESLHWPTVDVVGTSRVAGAAVSAAQPRARLNLYASGAIEAQVERDKLREASLASTEHQTREDVAFSVIQAWLRVVRAEGQLEAAQRSLARHEDLQKDFEAIAQIDEGRRYDLIQARTRTEQVRLLVANSEAEIALARAALARYASKPLPSTPLGLPAKLPPPASESAMAALIERHPAIVAAKRQLESARVNTEVARANRLPRLDLESTVGKNSATQLLLSWPAFDRGADAAEEAAQAQVGAESAKLAEQRQTIAQDMRTARQEWISVGRRAEIAASQVRLANELALTYREQFKIGRRNLLDLLNAFNELYQAESTLSGARVDRVLARLKIEYTAGRLVPVFVEGASS